jgi:hypothetical protein
VFDSIEINREKRNIEKLMNEFGTTQIKHTIKEVCVKKNLNVLMC